MMQEKTLAERIQRELKERANIRIVVGEADDLLILDGAVTSEEDRQRAEQIAAAVAPDKRIQNDLDVTPLVTERRMDEIWSEGAGEPAAEETAPEEAATEETLPFSEGADTYETGVPLETNEIDVVDDTVYDEEPEPEPEPSYFPPTDPVFTSDRRGNLEVLGGFTPTSTTSDEVEPSVEDTEPGDEAIAEAARRELLEDAATTDLHVEVEVTGGVVRLRGWVPTLEDAENAEAVVSQVPGVREVIEELDVSAP